ncbi:unnamed protein product [Acanthoscelides obtectus]|uniref:Uncharacterized protein n=1 Tax=Acanthoscelides obtectus TaxID=200917 RepID=A0A9P0LQZ1_ACAOB|nr:unnamed protein product [Acanthoscelides obtectus]CAK1675877.1 SCAN domain-containing protein 3 [Acanthoscelides obtectus]
MQIYYLASNNTVRLASLSRSPELETRYINLGQLRAARRCSGSWGQLRYKQRLMPLANGSTIQVGLINSRVYWCGTLRKDRLLLRDAMLPSQRKPHTLRVWVTAEQTATAVKGRPQSSRFESIQEKKRPTRDRMFASTSQRNDDGLRASYNISLLIAKSGKPHTIGEKLILPAVEEVLKTVLHKPASDIIKRIPLSNNTVERRIDEMSSDIESFLCNYLQTTHFSIQLDELTLTDNAALLLAYVRFIMNQEIYE